MHVPPLLFKLARLTTALMESLTTDELRQMTAALEELRVRSERLETTEAELATVVAEANAFAAGRDAAQAEAAALRADVATWKERALRFEQAMREREAQAHANASRPLEINPVGFLADETPTILGLVDLLTSGVVLKPREARQVAEWVRAVARGAPTAAPAAPADARAPTIAAAPPASAEQCRHGVNTSEACEPCFHHWNTTPKAGEPLDGQGYRRDQEMLDAYDNALCDCRVGAPGEHCHPAGLRAVARLACERVRRHLANLNEGAHG